MDNKMQIPYGSGRIVIDENQVLFYDANNVVRVRMKKIQDNKSANYSWLIDKGGNPHIKE